MNPLNHVRKKIDYLKHCKKFLQKTDTSPTSRKAYALYKRLSDNTFRVHLSKYIKSEKFKKNLEQQSIIKELKKRKSKNDVKLQKGDVTPNLHQLDNGCRTFVKGNDAAWIHGRNSKTMSQIKSVFNSIDNMTKESLCDTRLAISMQLEKHQINYSDYIKIIENDYAEGRAIILKRRSEHQVLNVEVSKSGALAEVEGQITSEIIELQSLIKQLDNIITEKKA